MRYVLEVILGASCLESCTSQFVDLSRESESALSSQLGHLDSDVVIEIDGRPHGAIVRDDVTQANQFSDYCGLLGSPSRLL